MESEWIIENYHTNIAMVSAGQTTHLVQLEYGSFAVPKYSGGNNHVEPLTNSSICS